MHNCNDQSFICFIDFFTAAYLFHQVIWKKTKQKASNGVWHETFNLRYVSSYQLFTFCDVIYKYKKRRGSVESAQYGMEINLKNHDVTAVSLEGKKTEDFCKGENLGKNWLHTPQLDKELFKR